MRLVSGWCPKGVRGRLSTSRPLWHPGTQSFVRCKEFSPPPVQLTAALRRCPCGRSPRLRVSGVGAQAPQPALCPEGSVHATLSPGFCPGGWDVLLESWGFSWPLSLQGEQVWVRLLPQLGGHTRRRLSRSRGWRCRARWMDLGDVLEAAFTQLGGTFGGWRSPDHPSF